jgi:hypothetical protein
MLLICCSFVNSLSNTGSWTFNEFGAPFNSKIKNVFGGYAKQYDNSTAPAPLEGNESLRIVTTIDGSEMLYNLNRSFLSFNGNHTIQGLLHSTSSTTANNVGVFVNNVSCSTRNGGTFIILENDATANTFGTFKLYSTYFIRLHSYTNDTIECNVWENNTASTGPSTYNLTISGAARQGAQGLPDGSAGVNYVGLNVDTIIDNVLVCNGIGNCTLSLINSSWNVTSGNIAPSSSSTAWNTGGIVNVTSNKLSGTFFTNIDANCSGRLDVEGNYSQITANNSNFKFATTDTTSQAFNTIPSFENLDSDEHCFYISCIDSNGLNETATNVSTSGCLNITVSISNFSSSINENITTLLYGVNYSRITINYSNPTVLAGNFTWNFSDYNITAINGSLWTFNFTSNGTASVNISLQQNQTLPWYQWWCWNTSTDKTWNITATKQNLFNLSAGTSKKINCTLDVINITMTFVNWSATVNKAYWNFTWNFTRS